MICICLCLSQCSWKTFWHSNLCGGDNFSRLQSLTKCWHTVFKWCSWGKKQSALLPSSHHSMLWCLLLYSLLVAHTVQQHSIAWRGWGRDPGEYSGLQVTRMIDWRQKSKPKKIPGPKFNPPKNPILNFQAIKISRKQRQAQSKFGFTLFMALRGWAYVGTITIFGLLWIPPKTLLKV